MSRPEPVRRHVVKQAATNQRLVFLAWLLIALGAIGYELYAQARDPHFAANIGTVTGLAHESEGEVLGALALAPDQNAWLINRRAAEWRIERLPWVGRASLHVTWPNEVTIDVIERTPMATVDLSQDTTQPPRRAAAIIDETQRVLAVTTARDEHAELPRIVVLPPPVGPVSAGDTLANSDVTQALRALRELRTLGLPISAVGIAPSTGISVTANRNLRVLFGDDEELAKKAQLFEAIVAKISTPERIAYVDVRSVRAPTVLYR